MSRASRVLICDSIDTLPRVLNVPLNFNNVMILQLHVSPVTLVSVLSILPRISSHVPPGVSNVNIGTGGSH